MPRCLEMVLELHLNNLPWDLALAEPPAWTDILTSTVLKKEFLLITVDRLMSGLSFLKPLNGSSPSPLVVKANSVSNPEGVRDTEQDRLPTWGVWNEALVTPARTTCHPQDPQAAPHVPSWSIGRPILRHVGSIGLLHITSTPDWSKIVQY